MFQTRNDASIRISVFLLLQSRQHVNSPLSNRECSWPMVAELSWREPDLLMVLHDDELGSVQCPQLVEFSEKHENALDHLDSFGSFAGEVNINEEAFKMNRSLSKFALILCDIGQRSKLQLVDMSTLG